MLTVGQIIRQRREALGLTLTALAQQVGGTKSYLSMIENHRVPNPPSLQVLRSLERALHISDGELQRAADWQNTPEPVRRELEAATRTAAEGREIARRLKALVQARRDGKGADLDAMLASGELRELVDDMDGDTADEPAADTGERSIDGGIPLRYRVPIINKVAAGYPANFTDLNYPTRVADEYTDVPHVDDPQAFAATVVGDSMLPDYREGDVVVFSPAAAVEDGSDCFVRLEPDHETTFKRVHFEDEGAAIRLEPLNDQYPSRVVERSEVAGMYRAVAKVQRLV